MGRKGHDGAVKLTVPGYIAGIGKVRIGGGCLSTEFEVTAAW